MYFLSASSWRAVSSSRSNVSRLNSLMPSAQFDVLENLDKPAMPVGRKSESYTLWERLETERDRYLDGVDVDLTPAKRDDVAS
jgi:hypothetical protein